MKSHVIRIAASALTWALVITGVPAVSPGATAHDAQHVSTAQRSEVRIPIGQFSLTDQNGRRFDTASIKGKIVLVDFAYTTCPDVCPLMTAAMRTVQTNLSANERKAVYLLTITTDPEIDIPKVLTAYAKRYHADLTNWAFLTGDPSSLAAVWKRFGVRVVRQARGLVDHTPLTAVVDRSGTMRFAYHGAAPDPKNILQDIRSLTGKDSVN